MLDDEDLGAEQGRMHGPHLAERVITARVIDVHRVDTDQARTAVAQIQRRILGQM